MFNLDKSSKTARILVFKLDKSNKIYFCFYYRNKTKLHRSGGDTVPLKLTFCCHDVGEGECWERWKYVS